MRCTILTLVTLIACQDKKPAPPPPPPPHDGVTLVSPGAAPFQTVRYHLARGSKTMSELVWDLTATNDGQPGPMPTLIIELETVVADVLPDGDAKLRITITRTRVRDQAGSSAGSELVREEAAAMQGVIITENLAPDGKLSDSHVDAATVPDNVRTRLDGLSRTLEQVAMQLPAEPVGLGATWRERKSLPAGGIRAVSETTYTVTSLTRDKIAYTGVGLATGTPQTIEQDGLKVEVTNTHGHSETTGALDLTRYAPEVTSTSTFTAAMNVVAPDQAPGAGPSTVEITMAIQVTPSDAARAEPAPAPAVATAPPSPDAGPAPSTAGLPPSDARPPSGAPEARSLRSAAGPSPPDVGPVASDAGPPAPDAGPPAPDAGPPPSDATPAPREAGSNRSLQGAHSAP
jgi:hypothetical protein